MKEIEVNGERYIKANNFGQVKIVVIDRGYIYVGRCEEVDAGLIIHNARCIIRWGTSKHLGELVDGPLENTKLGEPCNVLVRWEQVNHQIGVNQNAWNY